VVREGVIPAVMVIDRLRGERVSAGMLGKEVRGAAGAAEGRVLFLDLNPVQALTS
jgi:hypothetical protein